MLNPLRPKKHWATENKISAYFLFSNDKNKVKTKFQIFTIRSVGITSADFYSGSYGILEKRGGGICVFFTSSPNFVYRLRNAKYYCLDIFFVTASVYGHKYNHFQKLYQPHRGIWENLEDIRSQRVNIASSPCNESLLKIS